MQDIGDIGDIYYLIHATNNPDCLSWNELKVGDFNTDDQFPGVYMSVITKHNIESESIYPGKYLMIFSKILLGQKNYHINLTDYNGILTENNTYYPWSLNKFVNINKNFKESLKTNNSIRILNIRFFIDLNS